MTHIYIYICSVFSYYLYHVFKIIHLMGSIVLVSDYPGLLWILFFNFLNGLQLTYSVPLVLVVQQTESVTHTHTHTYIYIPPYIITNYWVHFFCAIQWDLVDHLFYTVVCICYSHPSVSSLPMMVPPMVNISFISKSVSFCFINKFLYNFISIHLQVISYDIFTSLSLWLHSVW